MPLTRFAVKIATIVCVIVLCYGFLLSVTLLVFKDIGG